MRAILKKDYEKGGSILSYEVINILTDGGLYNADELLFYDCNEDAEYPRWEERRYEIAKSAMNAMLANPELLEVVTHKEYVVGKSCQERVAKMSVAYADALIAELKKKGE